MEQETKLEDLCRLHLKKNVESEKSPKSSPKSNPKTILTTTPDPYQKGTVDKKPVIVWLTPLSEARNSEEYQNVVQAIKVAVSDPITFSDTNDCTRLFEIATNTNFVLIVSGSIGESFVPLVHQIDCLKLIYIFCLNRGKHMIWARKWPKIQGVFTELPHLCEMLRWKVDRYGNDSTPFQIFSRENSTANISFSYLDKSFMYTQILRDILLTTKFKKSDFHEFIKYSQEKYGNCEKDSQAIEDFRKHYEKNKAIWWYTKECFLYPMLNRALRSMEVDVIIKIGFFIQDLHSQITRLHKQQYIEPQQFQPFEVYRGQILSVADFNQLKDKVGHLLSFNSFLSTSRKQNVGLIYAKKNLKDSDGIGIVFQMKINPAQSQTPFALINDYSFFRASEQEILFSMHSVFRIVSITPIADPTNSVWNVDLILTNENNATLFKLTECIRNETHQNESWLAMAHVLLKLGRYSESESIYKTALSKAKKDTTAHIYHQLGILRYQLGDFEQAIRYFEDSLAIDQKRFSSNSITIAATYNDLGKVYQKKSLNEVALIFFERATGIYRANSVSESQGLAECLMNLGSVHFDLENYNQALQSHEAAFEIMSKILPEYHANIASCYNHIGLVYLRTSQYSNALVSFEKALTINQHILPHIHPEIAWSHQNLGNSCVAVGRFDKALMHFELAADIYEKVFPADHPEIASCYFTKASLYYKLGDFDRAMIFHQKAFEIRRKTFAENHPSCIESDKAIAETHLASGNYEEARAGFERVLKIHKQRLASNSIYLARSYFNLYQVFVLMNNHEKAEEVCTAAVEIAKQILDKNEPELIEYELALKEIRANRQI